MTHTVPAGDPTRNLPHAYGGPVGRGRLRSAPQDFQVDELLGYQASGAGEHAFLVVRKTNLNTLDLVKRIADLADVPQKDIGFAGLKDRVAVTTQAFSVRLAGKTEPDWSLLDGDSVQVMSAQRHDRKIRRGSLRGNRFELRIREVQGDHEAIAQRLELIARQGVPNYFGTQRFGIQGRNLQQAQAYLSGQRKRLRREQRGLLLSAVRSWLFNTILSKRVSLTSWNRAQSGDVYQLDGSQRTFVPEADDPEVERRVRELDIHPTGLLPGRASRANDTQGEVAALEREILDDHSFWVDGLERAGLDADRRSLRLLVRELSWAFEGDALLLKFDLDAGAYATVLLREVVATDDASRA